MAFYTSIPQSKILSKILPVDSADMYWLNGNLENCFHEFTPRIITMECVDTNFDVDAPCWSINALLNVLPNYEIYKHGNEIQLDVNCFALATEDGETLVDLVVNMIIELHKQFNKIK